MHKKSTIIAGMIIFAGLFTFPFWSNAGKGGLNVELEYPKDHTECVESEEYMRSHHMKMLHDWRDEVVRGEDHVYKNSKGVEYNKSLTNTCLACHDNPQNFCAKCHQSASVDTYCFDCHNTKPVPGTSPFHTKVENPVLGSQPADGSDGAAGDAKTILQKAADAVKGAAPGAGAL